MITTPTPAMIPDSTIQASRGHCVVPASEVTNHRARITATAQAGATHVRRAGRIGTSSMAIGPMVSGVTPTSSIDAALPITTVDTTAMNPKTAWSTEPRRHTATSGMQAPAQTSTRTNTVGGMSKDRKVRATTSRPAAPAEIVMPAVAARRTVSGSASPVKLALITRSGNRDGAIPNTVTQPGRFRPDCGRKTGQERANSVLTT